MTQKESTNGEFSSESMRHLMAMACAELRVPTSKAKDLESRLLHKLAGKETSIDEIREQLTEITGLLGSDDSAEEFSDMLRHDGSFETRPSDDHMLLLLDIEPPFSGGKAVDRKAVFEALQEAGLRQGVLVKAIDCALAEANENKSVKGAIIVRGRLAGLTVDGCALITLRKQLDQPQEEVSALGPPTGDHKRYWFCRQGDKIATILPGQRGAGGFDALGNELLAPEVRNVLLKAGPNIRQDGADYRAEAGGVVFLSGNVLEIRKLMIISEDISKQDPPINLDGEVFARGSVRDGARVAATGNITVLGPVEGAEIVSKGGEVHLRGGIVGHGRGRVEAKKGIRVRFAENAMLQCDGDIDIESAAMHCQLIAGRHIFCSRGRGQILGGIAMAGESVEVRRLGAPAGVNTDVVVGMSAKQMRILGRIDRLIGLCQARRARLGEIIDRIRRTVGDPNKLKPAERQVFAMLLQNDLILRLRVDKLAARRNETLRLGAEATSGEVVVYKELMPRAHIRIGEASLGSDANSGSGRFTYSVSARQIVRQPV